MNAARLANDLRRRYGRLFASLPKQMRFWRVRHLTGLITLASRFPAGAEGLEVGSFAGESAVLFLESGVRSLVCLDCWTLPPCPEARRGRIALAEKTFDAVQAAFPKRIAKWRMPSDYGMEQLAREGRRFDFVYIDADHSEEAVLRDIALARPLIKPGGLLAGHDYGRAFLPGVTRAVDQALGGPDETFEDYSWLKRLA